MTKLQAFDNERDPLRRNRLLFDWLRDDRERKALYAELRTAGCPRLQLKSVLRTGGNDAAWPSEDLYLISKRSEVEHALKHDSVKPYAGLDSGGRFMLGLDDETTHAKQRKIAAQALHFSPGEIEACARVACERACVLPLKNADFDLLDLGRRAATPPLADEAALRFVALLFGLPNEAHSPLREAMSSAYTRLTFQIIGRHFVCEPGLSPSDSPEAVTIRDLLEGHIRDARDAQHDRALQRRGLPQDTAIARLYRQYGHRAEEPVFVALGLMAGTVGNIRAAVAIAIDHFFAEGALIDQARQAARLRTDLLEELIGDALLANPPAPFLARTARKGGIAGVPAGAHLLLLMGVDPDRSLLFGGGRDFMHHCVGRHLAWPLVVEVVRQVLLLPGLGQVIDPQTGTPKRLEKRWGAICDKYPLRYQRDRRLNQQPLYVVLPIKPPIRENAKRLELLTRGGAFIVEQALGTSRHVHFAWFNLVEGGTHLAMSTVYDGDFDAYVEHFATTVELFDKQFEFLDVDQPRPIKDYPKQFVDNIRKYNRAPLGGYFFSAYPGVSVADIDNTLGAAP